MVNDPIVEEVRKTREKICSRYGDAESYYQHLLDVQKSYKDQLVQSKKKSIVSRKKVALGRVAAGTPAHR